jgi:predicted nucleotidyltransferase
LLGVAAVGQVAGGLLSVLGVTSSVGSTTASEINTSSNSLVKRVNASDLTRGAASGASVGSEVDDIQRSTRFIGDADGSIKDLATGRGNLNPIGRQGPLKLPSSVSLVNRGVPEDALARLVARLKGLRFGENKFVVESVEAFGSRAGSTFRGPGPKPTSDLDLLIKVRSQEFTTGATIRQQRFLNSRFDSIKVDFDKAAGFPVNFKIIGGSRNFNEFRRKFVEEQPSVILFER